MSIPTLPFVGIALERRKRAGAHVWVQTPWYGERRKYVTASKVAPGDGLYLRPDGRVTTLTP